MYRFMYPAFFGISPCFRLVGMYFPVIVLFGFMFSILWYVQKSRHQKNEENKVEDPLEILTERFAKGEITIEEFESMAATLESHRDKSKKH